MGALLRFALSVLKVYWWVVRPFTVGVKAVIVNEKGEVLLVKHTYQDGWHLPGGAVKKGESVSKGIEREIREEVGVICRVTPRELKSVYYNQKFRKNDHISLFHIKEWQEIDENVSSIEIAESGFFALEDLPEDTTRATRERIQECVQGQDAPERW